VRDLPYLKEYLQKVLFIFDNRILTGVFPSPVGRFFVKNSLWMNVVYSLRFNRLIDSTSKSA
jgi:hypothetical protein